MNNKIYYKGFTSILFFLTEEFFLGFGIPHLLCISKQNTYISILIAFLLGIPLILIFIGLFEYKKDKNIFQKIDLIYGTTISKIINFIITIFVIIYFIFSLWLLSIYIQNKYLNETPSYIITIIFLIPVIYLVSKDIKTISKVSIICFIFATIEITLSILGLVNLVEIDNLKPFFEVPFFKVIKSSYFCLSYFITPIFLLLSVPANQIDKPKNCKKYFFLFYTFAFINLFLLIIFIISIFGIDLANLYYFPEFALLEKISYFNFIEHVENILSMQWMFGLFLNSVMSLYFIKTYFKHNNFDTKKIYYTFIFISLILSFIIFKNTTQAFSFLKNYLTLIYTIPILLFLILTFILSKTKKK